MLPTLALRDVFMTSFLAAACADAPYTVLAYRSVVDLDLGLSFFRLPMSLRDESCLDTALPVGATVAWTTDDPAIATVAMPTDHGFLSAGDFDGVSAGTTMATITLHDAGGTALAHQRLPVIVE